MRAPAFWYRPAGLHAALLSPLSLFYGAGSAVQRAMITPHKAQKPVICIGNLVAGGAGKTPTALAIAHILQQAGQKPVFVTRGYGGNARGPLCVDPDRHSARDVGDEALLLAPAAPTFVGRDRAATIREAEKHGTHVILDDGLQNPHLLPDLSLLVIDGETGLGNGCLLPAGPLRETLGQALRRVAGVVLLGARDAKGVLKRIKKPVLRAQLKADLPADFPRDGKFFAFAGIARPEKFYETCHAEKLMLAGVESFADHHFFTAGELAQLRKKAGALGARLLTTAKDYVRLPQEFRARVTVLPVRLEFDDVKKISQLLNLPI